MWLAIVAGLLVSLDALFIGISFGTQKRCKFWHILIINAVLIGLCFLGYLIGSVLGDAFDDAEDIIDLVVGISFITLGLWFILFYFLFEHKKYMLAERTGETPEQGLKTIIMTGILMSLEAMLITIGLTLTVDITSGTIWIPITVGIAHLVYCSATFFLAKYLRRLPHWIGHVVAGIALIIYGTLALVL